MRDFFLPSTRKDEKEIARTSTFSWKEKTDPTSHDGCGEVYSL
jgi:hypothetical protein